MIDVKQAVESATKYFREVMAAFGVRLSDVRLEEVEISDDERLWSVTLSAFAPRLKPPPVPEGPVSQLATIFAGEYEQIYRVFTVRSDDGSVRSMKIRQT